MKYPPPPELRKQMLENSCRGLEGDRLEFMTRLATMALLDGWNMNCRWTISISRWLVDNVDPQFLPSPRDLNDVILEQIYELMGSGEMMSDGVEAQILFGIAYSMKQSLESIDGSGRERDPKAGPAGAGDP
jgi:hypothetical protein